MSFFQKNQHADQQQQPTTTSTTASGSQQQPQPQQAQAQAQQQQKMPLLTLAFDVGADGTTTTASQASLPALNAPSLSPYLRKLAGPALTETAEQQQQHNVSRSVGCATSSSQPQWGGGDAGTAHSGHSSSLWGSLKHKVEHAVDTFIETDPRAGGAKQQQQQSKEHERHDHHKHKPSSEVCDSAASALAVLDRQHSSTGGDQVQTSSQPPPQQQQQNTVATGGSPISPVAVTEKDTTNKPRSAATATTTNAISDDERALRDEYLWLVHAGARLLAVFQCCAVHGGLKVSGRLFVTSSALCFLSDDKAPVLAGGVEHSSVEADAESSSSSSSRYVLGVGTTATADSTATSSSTAAATATAFIKDAVMLDKVTAVVPSLALPVEQKQTPQQGSDSNTKKSQAALTHLHTMALPHFCAVPSDVVKPSALQVYTSNGQIFQFLDFVPPRASAAGALSWLTAKTSTSRLCAATVLADSAWRAHQGCLSERQAAFA